MRVIAIGVGFVALLAAAAIVAHYPLNPIPLIAALLLYAAALWRWTGLWLVVLPLVIPCLDLSPWTGWLLLSEAEPFVLVTLAILGLRAPLIADDVIPPGWTGRWLLVAVAVGTLGLVLGLASPDPPTQSALAFLTWENTIRQVKGPILALALLPFLRQRQRVHQDMPGLLGAGMLLGLAGVGALVVLERALFVSVLDFTSDYRAVGPFASMQFGGGHIGAYLTMALPFLVWCLPRPGRGSMVEAPREIAPGVRLTRMRDASEPPPADRFPWGRLLLGVVAGALGVFALSVTFARTGLVATLLAVGTAAALYGLSVIRRRGAILAASLGAGLALCVLAAVLTAVAVSPRLASRFATVLQDFDQRQANWTGGLAMMDRTVPAHVFGMGAGTYPRVARARAIAGHAPAHVSLVQEGSTRVLRLYPGSPLYLGQKIMVEPRTEYQLTLWLRAPDGPASLRIMLCEKLLLYSDDCRAREIAGEPGPTWRKAEMTLPSGDLGTPRLLGMARPIEFALTAGASTEVLDVNTVSLRDPAGRDILSNGSWLFGLDRWFPTDDNHLVWQIKNLYLMLWFEHGAVGLLAFLCVAGCAILAATRSALAGDALAAPITATLVGFLAAGTFDNLMMAPRLSLLFWLMVMAGLSLVRPADNGKSGERTIC